MIKGIKATNRVQFQLHTLQNGLSEPIEKRKEIANLQRYPYNYRLKEDGRVRSTTTPEEECTLIRITLITIAEYACLAQAAKCKRHGRLKLCSAASIFSEETILFETLMNH